MRATDEAEQMDFNALLFPGRKMLYVGEVAARLEVTDQHVLNMIEAGEMGAINVGLGDRKFWRVPVGELEKCLRRRASVGQG